MTTRCIAVNSSKDGKDEDADGGEDVEGNVVSHL